MRSLIVSTAVTLDGFAAGPGGNPLALNLDAAFDDHNLSLMREAGTILLGRTSFELFSSFWPMVADAPEDPSNPALSAVNREFSGRYRDIQKLVVSDRYEVPGDNPWRDTTTVVRGDAIRDLIEREKAAGDGSIVVFASGTLWNGLLADGLVDRMDLIVGPDAIGEGVPAFRRPVRLDPVEARILDGSRNTLLRYVP
ncbi:dihydrofolate reductase family protein [Leifsonia sp. fls2-241-R2A-40a]|uniref:dihydrofolate reductase family protein n=1 Tax=Leifsonia sp. fls2-241-R2A-40a TaxID=3040290 RepID=UPI00254F2A02|nr:dihydrofolate reductase family protein [Leifsonia sp. fls2-241-R2A-40a]